MDFTNDGLKQVRTLEFAQSVDHIIETLLRDGHDDDMACFYIAYYTNMTLFSRLPRGHEILKHALLVDEILGDAHDLLLRSKR